MKTRNYSKKREAILAKIRSTTCHPTAEWLYRELKEEHPDLSLGTVYRNLALFKEEGDIISVATVDGQERVDGNVAPHGHFICPTCRGVIDIVVSPEYEEVFSHLEKAMGFQVDRIDFTAYGTCNTCREAS